MSEPMFWIDPLGNLEIDSPWRGPVAAFCLRIREVVGDNVIVNSWFYRVGLTPYFALDIKGDRGEVNLTMMESEVNELPSAEMLENQGDYECRVMDMVDAYYLASEVFSALEGVLSCVLAGPSKR